MRIKFKKIALTIRWSAQAKGGDQLTGTKGCSRRQERGAWVIKHRSLKESCKIGNVIKSKNSIFRIDYYTASYAHVKLNTTIFWTNIIYWKQRIKRYQISRLTVRFFSLCMVVLNLESIHWFFCLIFLSRGLMLAIWNDTSTVLNLTDLSTAFGPMIVE